MGTKFEDLVGKILKSVKVSDDKWTIDFETEEGEKYELYGESDCCNSVTVEDVIGNLEDLIGSPVLMAEEVTNEEDNNPKGVPKKEHQDSLFKWTFYKLATVKGYVTIRWYGESNGYYSVSVVFKKVD